MAICGDRTWALFGMRDRTTQAPSARPENGDIKLDTVTHAEAVRDGLTVLPALISTIIG
jgi:hypothetical protein